jgi:hypothetical protein
METNEIDIIRNMRAEVMSRKDITGENLFLVWGYPTAIVLFIEYLALITWGENWCAWLWVLIPLISTPLMIHYLRVDYKRTQHRTHEQSYILTLWIFIGIASCVGGAAMGFADVFEKFFFSYLGLLCGLGCFLTGIILYFRPKTVCGIVASLLSIIPLFLQGDNWPLQLLVTSAIVVIALIIPGHLFKRYVREYYS